MVSPLVKLFVAVNMPPSALTVFGILITGLAFFFLYLGSGSHGWLWARIAGGVILFAAAWDTIDGEVARARGRASAKGAFLDSVLDRLSEFIVFLGLFMFAGLSELDSILLFALVFTSYTISYTRARAEGVGIDCPVGVFDRATRIFVIGIGLIVIPMYINWIIRALLLGTAVTAIRRFVYVLTRKQQT
jgi:CDP-diacylglycerol--glycerol-3-phosphate 3-phosphatidyltransferase